MNVKEMKLSEVTHSLASLDQARDKLFAEANKKDEAIAELQKELEERRMGLTTEQLRVAQLGAELEQVRERVRERDKEMSRREARHAETNGQLQESQEQALSLATQVRLLRDDLETMTQVRVT